MGLSTIPTKAIAKDTNISPHTVERHSVMAADVCQRFPVNGKD
jgi:FixJ family two-component response regulator